MNAPAFLKKAPANAISAELYNGHVSLVRGDFGRKKHAYYLPETNYFVPGVTSILSCLDKPALIPWAARMAAEYVKANIGDNPTKAHIEAICDKAKTEYNKIKEAAGDIGTQVHIFAEKYFRGEVLADPENELVKAGVKALLDWTRENDIRPIEVERLCFSQDSFYAGTMDLLASVNGKLSYVDLKTGKGIYKEHLLQSGAYVNAWQEENKEVIEQIVIVNCNKLTGVAKIKLIDDLNEIQFYIDTFLRVKNTHDNLRKMEDIL